MVVKVVGSGLLGGHARHVDRLLDAVGRRLVLVPPVMARNVDRVLEAVGRRLVLMMLSRHVEGVVARPVGGLVLVMLPIPLNLALIVLPSVVRDRAKRGRAKRDLANSIDRSRLLAEDLQQL